MSVLMKMTEGLDNGMDIDTYEITLPFLVVEDSLAAMVIMTNLQHDHAKRQVYVSGEIIMSLYERIDEVEARS